MCGIHGWNNTVVILKSDFFKTLLENIAF
jgi:hypothetical protein